MTDNTIRITYIVAAAAFVLSMISIGALLTADDEVSEVSASLSNRLNSHETHIDDLETDIETLETSIDTERRNNIAMAEIILELEEDIEQHQIDIAVLEARGDKTTLPKPTEPEESTIDLRLKISDNKGNTKSQGYPRDVPAILIQGETTYNKKSFLITIKDPNGAFVKDKFGETLRDGDISEAWIPSSNPVAGTYVVTIKIDLKTDSITFDLL